VWATYSMTTMARGGGIGLHGEAEGIFLGRPFRHVAKQGCLRGGGSCASKDLMVSLIASHSSTPFGTMES
jgi:hypothetical protein